MIGSPEIVFMRTETNQENNRISKLIFCHKIHD